MDYPVFIDKTIVYNNLNMFNCENVKTLFLKTILDLCTNDNKINISKLFELCVLYDYIDIVEYFYEELNIEYDI